MANELGWNIANKGHELYLGIDRGKVHSSQEELQIGDSLMGGAIGLRGKYGALIMINFVGVPNEKNRKDLEPSHVTTGFNVSYRFLMLTLLDE